MNVLCIEDDADYGIILGHAFRSQRTVSKAPCLTLAWPLMKRIPMDLVLLDLTLCDATPLETVAEIVEIKRRSPKAKVIVLTGHLDDYIRRKAYAAGADSVLQKDTDYRTTVAAIMDICRQNQPPECLDAEKVKLIEERVRAIVDRPQASLFVPSATVAAVVQMLGQSGARLPRAT